MVGNHLILQICKIHLAYATIRMAAMNWENNFKYVFIRKSHIGLSGCSVVMCRNQDVVLAALQSYVLVFILFVVLVMACASHRLETISHDVTSLLQSTHVPNTFEMHFLGKKKHQY